MRLCLPIITICLTIVGVANSVRAAETQPATTMPPAETSTETTPAQPADKPTGQTDQPASETNTTTTTETETPTKEGTPKPPTDEDIGKIIWQEFGIDNSWENPFALDLSNLDDFPERRKDWDDFLENLASWQPGQVPKVEEKVRNLLCVAVLEDIGQGQFEAELPLHIYRFLRKEVPEKRLKEILAMTAFYPEHGPVIETAPELNLDIGVGEKEVRWRLQILAVKMLGRMLGKLPYNWDEDNQQKSGEQKDGEQKENPEKK